MISFDLCCGKGHRFEGWFSSSSDYEIQQTDGRVKCPVCDNGIVSKALSVPNIGRKSSQAKTAVAKTPTDDAPVSGGVFNAPSLPPAMMDLMQKMATAQSEMLKTSQWVGRQFAETARAIHYGESDNRSIHGETSPDEADALAEEGISVAPLPFPFIPPEAKN